MKIIAKVIVIGMLSTFSTSLLADKPTIHTMQIKLSNLEVDITKKKLKLVKREENLNAMKVKSFQADESQRKKLTLKLAEIEAALAKDKLLLSEREVKLYEMKVALLQAQQ